MSTENTHIHTWIAQVM